MPTPHARPRAPALLSASLPAAPSSAAEARRGIREALGTRIEGDLLDTLLLLVTELVSNAVACSATSLELRVVDQDGALRVEVADTSAVQPRVVAHELLADHGRGLAIVEALSHTWGVFPRPGLGKVVWFALRT